MTLNPQRTGLLIRNEALKSRAPIIMLAATAGTVFVLYVLTCIGGASPEFHEPVYTISLVVLGYILSSFAFAEVHDARTGAYALTSPGSLLEKYVSRILLTSVGWAIAITVVYIATTAAAAGVAQLLFGRSHGVFLLNQGWMWKLIAAYIVSQGVFVLGSIYFRKAAFLKTVLAATLIAILFGIFFMIAWRVVYWGAFAAFCPTEEEMTALMNINTPAAGRLVDVLKRIGDVLRWTLLPVFTWIVGYLRLRETEV
jgi:hypothetical protein